MNKNNAACIASKNAAEIFGIPVIKQGIEDNTNNYTRFLVLSKESNQDSLMSKQNASSKEKTSIIFSVKHEAGALYQIIKEFAAYKINLTKIESRPNKNTAWEYNFYVDFEGSQDDSVIKEMLQKIKGNSSFLKILGTYPMTNLD